MLAIYQLMYSQIVSCFDKSSKPGSTVSQLVVVVCVCVCDNWKSLLVL